MQFAGYLIGDTYERVIRPAAAEPCMVLRESTDDFRTVQRLG